MLGDVGGELIAGHHRKARLVLVQGLRAIRISLPPFDELETRLLSMRSPKLRLIPKPRNSQPPPVFDKSPTNPNKFAPPMGWE